jgi:excisionase family DNA binding protein
MHVDARGRNEDLLTPKEVCQILRIGRSALYEWLARQELPHYKLGRVIRIGKSDSEEFMQRKRVDREVSRRASVLDFS